MWFIYKIDITVRERVLHRFIYMNTVGKKRLKPDTSIISMQSDTTGERSQKLLQGLLSSLGANNDRLFYPHYYSSLNR